MFGLFKRRPNGPLPILVFKSSEAALDHCCKFMDCELREQAMLPAVVLDASELHGTPTAVAVRENGIQVAVILVPSDDGGFETFAETSGGRGPKLKPGDLVAWLALTFNSGLAEQLGDDPRRGWMGLIVGTLKPEYDNGMWVGGEQFRE